MDDLTLAQAIFSQNSVAARRQARQANNTTTIVGLAITDSSNGIVQVLIDNQPTNVSTTFAVKTGDECIISVTNNTPIVTGLIGKGDNVDQTIDGTIKATSAIISTIIAGSVSTDILNAIEGYIKNLTVENFEANKVKATTAELLNLVSNKATFNTLIATEANIKNLTADTAYIRDLTAQNITVDDLNAVKAYIQELAAENVTAEKLTVATAYISALYGEYAEVKELVADLLKVKQLDVDKLNAIEGFIGNLVSNKITAEVLIANQAIINDLDTNFAHINLANVNNAWIDKGVIKKGVIQGANIADATITAANIHDINADNITAGTLKTERLIITDSESGEESIVKAINVANGVAEPNGSKLQAQSIDVVDLYAFNATIGGFDISERSLYNAKDAIDNPDSGVYIGLDGVGIGNGHLQGLEDKSPFMMKSDGTFWLGGRNGNISFDPLTGDLDINASDLNIATGKVMSDADVKKVIEGLNLIGPNIITKNDVYLADDTEKDPESEEPDNETIKTSDYPTLGLIEYSTNKPSESQGFYIDNYLSLEHETPYVLSWKAEVDTGTVSSFKIISSVDNFSEYSLTIDDQPSGNLNTDIPIDISEWCEFIFRFKTSDTTDSSRIGDVLKFSNEDDTPLSVKIKDLKLEKGDYPTDWTPARTDELSTDDIAELMEKITTIQANEQGFKVEVETATTNIAKAMEEASDARRFATDYLTFNDGELRIGTSESKISTILDNQSLKFIEDGSTDAVAYFGKMKNNESVDSTDEDGIWKFQITNGYISDTLNVGNFSWIKRSNGNMSLKWVG